MVRLLKTVLFTALLLVFHSHVFSAQVNTPISRDFKNIEKYAKEHKIKLSYFSKRNTVTNKSQKLMANLRKGKIEPIKVIYQEELFKTSYYKTTNGYGDYLYLGEIKNKRPSGIGVLVNSIKYGDNIYYFIKYSGEFKDGVIIGYGMEFRIPIYDNEISEIESKYGIDRIYDLLNYIRYEGNFKNNKYNGRGQSFDYSAFSINFEIGNYKDDKLNGKANIYIGGKLFYSGGIKNEKFDGTGKKYFIGSNQLEYVGGFKNDNYHGTGKLYDEKGKVIYSGKWENGDYK